VLWYKVFQAVVSIVCHVVCDSLLSAVQCVTESHKSVL
jgi:hypothetical protein